MRGADVAAILRGLVALGPRATGSAGEAAAAAWAADRFCEAGLTVETQPFEASRWPYRIVTRVLPFLVAAALIRGGVWLVVVLGATAIAAAGHRRLVSLFDLGDRFRSTNVIGRSVPRGERKVTLLLCAHLDVKTGLLPLGGRVALVIVAVLAAASGAFVDGFAIAGAVALVVIALDPPMPSSRGAFDDGSGMALLAALSRELPGRIGDRVELVFLATGAEERGMAGALRFAQHRAQAFDRSSTLAVNLDILGSTAPVLLAGSEGPFDAEVRVLCEALTSRGLRTRRLPLLVGAGMDHQRLAAAGLHAISLTQPTGPAAWRVHTRWDRFEAVDTERLALVGEAVVEMAERLAPRS